jgi:predicted  nucleic acid-binding Zn-ribbon protein
MWTSNNKYKEITLIVPEERFGKLPEKISYKYLPYGRIEKASRLLIRSIMSAIDNGKNADKYGALRSEYHNKRREKSQLRSEVYRLRNDLKVLRSSAEKFGLKIEGCSVIKKDIEMREEKIETIEEEMKEIKEQIPKYMWESMYWW